MLTLYLSSPLFYLCLYVFLFLVEVLGFWPIRSTEYNSEAVEFYQKGWGIGVSLTKMIAYVCILVHMMVQVKDDSISEGLVTEESEHTWAFLA